MRIALLGCKGTTLDLLDSIVSQKSIKVDLVITLPEHIAEKNQVAFYRGREIAHYCEEHGIPVHMVKSYHLNDDEDLQFFQAAGIDLMLVIGWERIVPGEVLRTLQKFACGMHGSPYGLPKGRGRSPLNWSIITGHNKFVTYLFRYNPLIDDGYVIGFKVFDINEFDTIASLHAKNRIAMYQLLEIYVPLIERDEVTFWPQPPGKVTYYPKRIAADSGIDWTQKTSEIYNLIRAVAPPYPPAYCYHKEKKIFIFEAYPFDSTLFHHSINPGTIVDVSISLGHMLVKTGDGTLIVKDFRGTQISHLRVGDVLQGINQNEILRQVAQRYPENTSDDEKEI
jgi:methionyl-tRNA formyltransferase